MSGVDWRRRAACAGIDDPDIFFPTAENGPVYDAQVAVAKTVCGGCPVRAECLTYAMGHLAEGIAGGLTPEERRRYRNGRASQRLAATAHSAAILELGLRRGAGRDEVAAAGRVLLTAGRPVREVALRCGVTERTASRWASGLRQQDGEQ
jgi:hypothetical protein